MAVCGSPAPKTANQLAIGLEGEDTARFVVNHNNMSIPVYSHSLGAHKTASSNLGLEEDIKDLILPDKRIAQAWHQSRTLGWVWTTPSPNYQGVIETSPQLAIRGSALISSSHLELALWGEDADPTVVIVCHNNVSIGVHCHTCGTLQLPR